MSTINVDISASSPQGMFTDSFTLDGGLLSFSDNGAHQIMNDVQFTNVSMTLNGQTLLQS